jgi:predicted amidohydrolase YtcJ
MKYFWFLAVTTVFLVGCSKSGTESAPIARGPEAAVPAIVADAVYTNGKIYTVNKAQPWVEAVAIKDGVFVVVGSTADVEVVIGDNTNVVDLTGRMVMPGMIDVHAHVLGKAMSAAFLDIQDPFDLDALSEEIRDYAEENPSLPYIRGEIWGLGVFENDSPRKELLDELVPDRPAYFYSQTAHSAWVNSKALELLGITADTPQTEKFIFDTDPESGEPSGTIREYAMAAMEQTLEPVTKEDFAPALQGMLEQFVEAGVTSIKNAGGEVTWVEGAMLLEQQGGLDVRLFPSWFYKSHLSGMNDDEMKDVFPRWEDYKTDLIYPRYVKMFFDGGPDSYSALLYEDYAGRPGFKGSTNYPVDNFVQEFSDINAQGLGLIVHVYGDASGGELVTAFSKVREENGDNGIPLHYSHSIMTRPRDIERLAQLSNVCMDFSPVLSFPHALIQGSIAAPIGEERYQSLFNVRSALDTGIAVALASDWPSTLNPGPNGFHDIQAWVTRTDPYKPDSGTLNADQAITLEEAIRGVTLGGAECLGFGWDDKLGSIEVGKFADFIVLDQNLFETPIAELYQTTVQQTYLNGTIVYDQNTRD